jgi:hypothetical protein
MGLPALGDDMSGTVGFSKPHTSDEPKFASQTFCMGPRKNQYINLQKFRDVHDKTTGMGQNKTNDLGQCSTVLFSIPFESTIMQLIRPGVNVSIFNLLLICYVAFIKCDGDDYVQ